MDRGRFPPIPLLRAAPLVFERPLLCAVVNVTPDSFSDGGGHREVESAVSFALRCVAAGADMVDVGGESTRPRAPRVSGAEERERVVPVIRALAGRVNVPLSVDTTKAEVAAAALAAGADIVNDISGGRFDPDLVAVAAKAGAALVLGHVRGNNLDEVHASEANPPTFEEVAEELAERVAALPPSLRLRALVDPGIGFGKRGRENLPLLRRAGELGAGLGRPVMVGPSRKRFLGELTGRPVDQRDDATIGACLAAAHGGADVLRVHDVGRVRDALTVYRAVLEAV